MRLKYTRNTGDHHLEYVVMVGLLCVYESRVKMGLGARKKEAIDIEEIVGLSFFYFTN